jgi:hypothetical protein
MSGVAAEHVISRWVRALAALVFLLACSAAARSAPVGRIIGNIDGIAHDGERSYIVGWTCQRSQEKSILVHIFGENPAHKGSNVFLIAAKANLESEPAVGQACGDHGKANHRFLIALPADVFARGRDRKLYVHGIRVVDGVANEAIAGSGKPLRELALLAMQFPPLAAFPALTGAYHSLAEHPRVFTTAAELHELAARINRPGSYSAQRFGQLIDQIGRDLAARIDWDAVYSGCKIKTYLFAFSYEPQEAPFLPELRADVKPAAELGAPAGAAVLAARLALYAALVKAGAAMPAGAPDPDQAAALAKRILLAWGERGYRDAHGQILTETSFCNEKGGFENPGLHISRGLVYSVEAQDLLMSLHLINDSEAKELNKFHAAMYDVMRRADNLGVDGVTPLCQLYANGQANVLASLLAIARLLDDRRKFDAALTGSDRDNPMTLSWIRFFDHAIYGRSDRPLECYPNTGSDGPHSQTAFTTAEVALGEVQDRYRNGNPLQGIGYPMFTLERLINSAEVMRIAGFDPYGYRGRHGQSIETAIAYYACLAKSAGFYKVISAANSDSCPNAPQYHGKVVNGVDPNVVIGAYRFPAAKAITDVEEAAKALPLASPPTTFSTDAILFGKWRD